MTKNRYFEQLPPRFKTDDNRRMSSVSDDLMFEPEDFGPIEGHVGNVDDVTEADLLRDPLIQERNAERARYQLSVGVVSGANGNVDGGVFYTDLINQLEANGGNVSDHSRLFDTDWYAWTPPIDYDRWTNFSRYRWLGQGEAIDQGEYITKDPAGSRTVLYRVDGPRTFTKVVVGLSQGVGVGSFSAGSSGELREDTTDASRRIYAWNGSGWDLVYWVQVAELPESTELAVGTYFYVARWGFDYNRITVYEFSVDAGRYLPRQPIVSPIPPLRAAVGTLWEDSGASPTRPIRRYSGSSWDAISFDSQALMLGYGDSEDGAYIYHTADVADVEDGWQRVNWWRHVDDLSIVDRTALTVGATAIRPILQIWGEIEIHGQSVRLARHTLPKFNVYTYKASDRSLVSLSDLVPAFLGTTMVRFEPGVGSDDPIIGFPCAFDNNGEFKFDLALESETIPATGYRFYKDAFTSKFRSVWTKASTPLTQEQFDDLTWEVPFGLSNNADHKTPTSFSRTDSLRHFAAVISEGSREGEEPTGNNSWRWSKQDPTAGALIIDPEASLLRPMALLLDRKLDIFDAMRSVGQETNRFYRRFLRTLDDLWSTGDYSTPADVLIGTAGDLVNEILTRVLVAKQPDGPYWLSGMGSYVDSLTDETKPIVVPPSTARTGATPVYQPRVLKNATGSGSSILCHDGRMIPAFGDDRDLVVLELENRFYSNVPTIRKTETEDFSAIDSRATWETRRYVGERAIEATYAVVDSVSDVLTLGGPIDTGARYYSQAQASIAIWDGTAWAFFPVSYGDVIKYSNTYAFFNGFEAVVIPNFQRGYDFDYTIDDANKIIRREFERWVIATGKDAFANTTYEESDSFTWNYSCVGLEGHWSGIYRRIYGTTRPHSAPWEICGFSIEPEWWRTAFVPTSTATDGSPRYASTHAMWAAIKVGGSFPFPLELWRRMSSDAPVPVDVSGNLLSPVDSGLVLETSMPIVRRAERWKFGDLAPVEQEFWASPEGKAAEAILGYLIKPARFLEYLWSDYVIPIGAVAGSELLGGVQVVNVSTLRRSGIADIPVHLTDLDGNVSQNPGVNAWVSDRIVQLGGSPTAEFADVVATSRTQLAWKTGGFIRGESLSISTITGIKVPDEDLSLVVNHSVNRVSRFHSGIIVVREADTTYRVFGYDPTDSKFTLLRGAKPIFAGQIELKEDFVSQAAQTEFVLQDFSFTGADTARVSVLVNGMKVDDSYVVKTSPRTVKLLTPPATASAVTVSLLTTQSNAVTKVRQFLTESGKPFYYYPSTDAVEEEIPYGSVLKSPQDVVEFIYDYGRWLQSKGWKYGRDEDPDVVKNSWLNVAQRFANWVSQKTRRAGDIFADTAGGTELRLELDFGQSSDLETVSNGSYPIVDLGGLPIPPSETTVTRMNGELTVTSPSREIFGLRVYERSSEHVVFISQKTKFGDLIYDPIRGVSHKKLLVKAMRSNGWKGRMEAPGYIIGETSLLPNLEKQAYDFIRSYDFARPVNDKLKLEQAWNLYGWSDPQYLVDIGASLSTRIGFHRGFLPNKGTANSFEAFVRGTSRGPRSASISESWAWLLSDFGALEHRTRVRFKVEESDIKSSVQTVDFVSALTGTSLSIEVLPFDRDNHADTRWIVPPKNGGNFQFPMLLDDSGQHYVPDTEKYSYRMRLVGDTQEGGVQDIAFHWDPAAGLHEPTAYSQITYVTPVDPAKYNTGEHASEAIGHEWGPAQVGKLWLDTSQLEYADYRDNLNDWGKLAHVKAVSQIETDSGYEVSTATPHGFTAGQTVIVKLKSGQLLYGYVMSVTDADTVVITMSIADDPEDYGMQASFKNAIISEIYTSDVRVYEWVEKLVTPLQLDEEGIRNYSPEAPSWVTRFDKIRQKTYYYYWVRGSVAPSMGRTEAAVVIEDRIRNPSSYGLTWFAPTSKTSFRFSGKNFKIDDRSAIEIAIDGNDVDYHQEWILVNEGETIDRTPRAIMTALLSSLTGEDALGGEVPWSGYTEEEKYGIGKRKTVFRNVPKAKAALIDSMNRVFSRSRVIDNGSFDEAFPNAYKDVWWERANWRRKDAEGLEITQIVKDRNVEIKLPREGDTVRINSAVQDPDGGETWALYRYENGEWVEIGAHKSTVKILDAIFTGSAAAVKSRIETILSKFEAEEENEIIFGLLYEMVSQHENCNWFFKTSLVDLEHTIAVGQPKYRPRDELPLLLAALDNAKPYHTKVRDISTTVEQDIDQSKNDVSDTYVNKISAFIDRVTINLKDESGWNSDAWDARPWDSQPWTHADLGRAQYLKVDEFTSDGSTRNYTVYGFRIGHGVKLVGYIGETETVVPAHTLTVLTNGYMKVAFNNAPASGIRFEALQARGAVYGDEPTSPDPDFEPVESTQKHAVARVAPYVDGSGNNREIQNSTALTTFGDVDVADPTGGGTDERVRVEWFESSLIKVTTDSTPAWGGWNTQPWNLHPWDRYYDAPSAEFFVATETNRSAASGFTEAFSTTETLLMDATNAAKKGASVSDRYRISKVEIDRGTGNEFETLVLGEDYELLLPNSVRFIEDSVVLGTSGTVFTAPFPIGAVYVDSVLVTLGVDYSVDGRTVTFASDPAGKTVVAKKYIGSKEGTLVRFTYSGFTILADRARASAKKQNFLSDPNNLTAWDAVGVSLDTAAPPAAFAAYGNSWTVTDSNPSVLGKLELSVAGVASPNCRRSLSFFVKKTLSEPTLRAEIEFNGSLSPVAAALTIDTNEGTVVQTSGSVERYKIHDCYDFWRVFMVARADGSLNADVTVTIYPAYNGGSGSSDVSRVGTKTIGYFWMTDSPYDDVAYFDTQCNIPYDVKVTVDGNFVSFDTEVVGATVGIVYHDPVEFLPRPTGLVTGMDREIVDFAESIATFYSDDASFDETRNVGDFVISKDDSTIYEYTIGGWESREPIVPNRTYFAKRSFVGAHSDGSWTTDYEAVNDASLFGLSHLYTHDNSLPRPSDSGGSMMLGRVTGALSSTSGAWAAANGGLVCNAGRKTDLAVWISAKAAYSKQVQVDNLIEYNDMRFWTQTGTGTVTLGASADPYGDPLATFLEDTSATETMKMTSPSVAIDPSGFYTGVLFVKKHVGATNYLIFGMEFLNASSYSVQITLDTDNGVLLSGAFGGLYSNVSEYDSNWIKVTLVGPALGNTEARLWVIPAGNTTGANDPVVTTVGSATVFSPMLLYGNWSSSNYPLPRYQELKKIDTNPYIGTSRIGVMANLGTSGSFIAPIPDHRPKADSNSYIQFEAGRLDGLFIDSVGKGNHTVSNNIWSSQAYLVLAAQLDSASDHTIVDKKNSGDNGWLLSVDSSGNVRLSVDFDSNQGIWASSIQVDTGSVFLVEVYYDGSSASNDPVFYINRQLASTVEESAPAGSIVDDSGTKLCIGSGGSTNTFDGRLVELAIIKGELTPIEMADARESIIERWLI